MGEAKGAITSENNYRLARPPLVPSRLFLSPGFRVEKRPGTSFRERCERGGSKTFLLLFNISTRNKHGRKIYIETRYPRLFVCTMEIILVFAFDFAMKRETKEYKRRE